ncbi:hypothetical protein [Vandammella animalimorsus]|uniref:Uncharacterized protein n=1 Tax=Vandammella animalimorsus TaxID=2029117 RepID=A0A2A2B0Q3_9BURK|nr:hypothetical protein [Vandammella animalimorsus]PAT43706.1 hypothetical protein CK621_02305 [Vandammella animalimorsus]
MPTACAGGAVAQLVLCGGFGGQAGHKAWHGKPVAAYQPATRPGLHAKTPPIEEQLPLLRALWPSPFVRLPQEPAPLPQRAYGYESAKAQYAPFDRLQDPDPETRAHLARVITGTCGAGQSAYVTINNKAEGCALLWIKTLALVLKIGTWEAKMY